MRVAARRRPRRRRERRWLQIDEETLAAGKADRRFPRVFAWNTEGVGAIREPTGLTLLARAEIVDVKELRRVHEDDRAAHDAEACVICRGAGDWHGRAPQRAERRAVDRADVGCQRGAETHDIR